MKSLNFEWSLAPEKEGVPATSAVGWAPYNKPWRASEKSDQRRLSPNKHYLPEPSEFGDCRSSTRRSKMKLSSALGLALVLAIVLLLVIPEVCSSYKT